MRTDVASPRELAVPLRGERVSKRYGRRDYVLRDLSFEFRPGTGVAILGPNGSGKTTLLRMLTCLAFPTDGMIRYGDTDIHEHPYRYLAKVGIVNESGSLPDHLSAEEVVKYVLEARSHCADAAFQEAVLDAVNLDERRSELIGTYSTGMRQKTQLAAALAARPPVLLLDEPFRGLDTETTDLVLDLLAQFKSAGGLLVFSSHQDEAVNALADEQLVMRRA